MPGKTNNIEEFKKLANAFEWEIDLHKNTIWLEKNFGIQTGIDLASEVPISDFSNYLLPRSAKELSDQIIAIKEGLRKDLNINLSLKVQQNKIQKVQFNGRPNGEAKLIHGIGMAGTIEEKSALTIDLSNVLRHSEEGIIILDENDKIIEINQAALGFASINTEEFKNQNIGWYYKALNPEGKQTGKTLNFKQKNEGDSLVLQLKAANERKKYLKIKEKNLKEGNENYKVLYISDITAQKKAEARSFLHSVILEKAPVAIIFTNPEGEIQFVNKAFSKITGYKLAEVKGQNPNILQSGTHNNAFYDKLWTTIKSGRAWQGKMLNKKKNGDLYWERAIITPHISEEGDLEGFIKVAEDITTQIETKQKLKESETRYRDVFETAGVGIIYINKEGRVLDANQKFNELLNTNEESLINKSALELINNKLPRPLAKELLSELFHVLKGNRIRPRAIQVYDKFYEIQSDYNPTLESNIGIIRDITDKKIAEQKLKKSEAKYRYLVENMNDGLAITNKNSEITFMNPAAEQIFEVQPHQVGSKTLKDVATPTSQEIISHEEEQRRMGNSSTYYIEVITRKNSKKNLEINASPIYDTEKNFNGSFAIIRDITEKLKAEMEIKSANSQLKNINKKLQEHATELEMAKDKAEESEKLKGAFLANISHEIRTPMNGIVGFAQLAMNSSLSNEKRNSYLQIVSDSTMQLESVVMDIIDLSKIESGESKFSKKTTDLKEIIDSIYDFYIAEARDKGLEFNLQYEGDIPKIKTDPIRYKQVVKKLVHNALKFTPEGLVSVSAKLEKTSITIIVKDTGIGIPKEYYDIIFEPFRQVEQAMKRRFGGTGLGLTIAREIAKNLSGDISLQSAPGQGSTFIFRHPLS
ncbi:MAG TPA: PAS domain S-box protein [Salinivirga sp.]|uniref:PAS domain S-box protein n=1 Tax=Salinivirga sp. TaxID=1970192 RepID=UPI002B47222F|nr:PAS domain S-box protein [Salinivirga sp.]HKK58538.1 PAS domain S-box protein [Salinivirga sp.]